MLNLYTIMLFSFRQYIGLYTNKHSASLETLLILILLKHVNNYTISYLSKADIIIALPKNNEVVHIKMPIHRIMPQHTTLSLPSIAVCHMSYMQCVVAAQHGRSKQVNKQFNFQVQLREKQNAELHRSPSRDIFQFSVWPCEFKIRVTKHLFRGKAANITTFLEGQQGDEVW